MPRIYALNLFDLQNHLTIYLRLKPLYGSFFLYLFFFSSRKCYKPNRPLPGGLKETRVVKKYKLSVCILDTLYGVNTDPPHCVSKCDRRYYVKCCSSLLIIGSIFSPLKYWPTKSKVPRGFCLTIDKQAHIKKSGETVKVYSLYTCT